MAKRLEPVRKSVKEVLEDLQARHREAAIAGASNALKYLTRTMEGQHSLPNAVKAVAYDLLAETRAQLQDWPGVEEAVAGFLKYLPDLEEALGHGYRKALEATTSLERGVQARTELQDFAGALALCDLAISLDLGAHWTAKRDNLDWAR
jgi:triacylglycerol esterase/lipase EstA (alpha/beta hydrolase family)